MITEKRFLRGAVAMTASVALVLSGCGSDDDDEGSNTTAIGAATTEAPASTSAATEPSVAETTAPVEEQTVTIGILTSETGPASAFYSTMEAAIKARFALAQEEGDLPGVNVEFAVADDQTTPDGNIAAARKLVEQDGADVVLQGGAVTFASLPYLAEQGIPTVACGCDSSEWSNPEYDIAFPWNAAIQDTSIVATTFADFFKSKGVTKLALFAEAGVPAEQVSNDGMKIAAENAGIEVVYENYEIPFTGGNFTAIALDVQNSGADGLFMPNFPTNSLGIVQGVVQAGVDFNAAVLLSGYDQPTLDNPEAREALSNPNVYISLSSRAVGTSDDPAAVRVADALAEHAGVEGIPAIGDNFGWVDADAVVEALKNVLASGDAISPETIRAGLEQVTEYDAGGLFGAPIDLNSGGADHGVNSLPGNCAFFVQVQGETFVEDPENSPHCGEFIE